MPRSRSPRQNRRTKGATAGVKPAENLSKCGRTIRWRDHPAQHRYRHLGQADAASGTFLFTLMHSDIIRIQLYVPQDEAFGLGRGSRRSCACQKYPVAIFAGTVTRIADALQPGTRNS